MRKVSDESSGENQNTHIGFDKRAVYETMWKYFSDPGRPQIKIWRMRIACWISMATSTHTLRICNIFCFSTATKFPRKRLNVTLYVHCLSC